MLSISQVEDAILEALEPMGNTHGVRELKTYQDELSDLKDKKLEAFLMRVPAIYLVYGGGDVSSQNALVGEEMFFMVFVADKYMGDNTKARRGANGRPGTYALMDGVHALLTNNTLSLDILPLELLKRESVYSKNGLSVYVLVYRTEQEYIKEIRT